MRFSRKPKPDPAEVAAGLRDQALALDHSALGLAPTAEWPQVWGILMETGYPQAIATLVALVDLESDLGNMRHALSPLFHAGHAVMTAVRKASGG